MSMVTNAILIHHILEEPVPGTSEEDEQWRMPEQLNEELRRQGIGWFNQVRSETGGRKRLECVMHVAALNGLNVEQRLVFAIESRLWEVPSCVQLFVKGQEEARFREVELKLLAQKGS